MSLEKRKILLNVVSVNKESKWSTDYTVTANAALLIIKDKGKQKVNGCVACKAVT